MIAQQEWVGAVVVMSMCVGDKARLHLDGCWVVGQAA